MRVVVLECTVVLCVFPRVVFIVSEGTGRLVSCVGVEGERTSVEERWKETKIVSLH